MIGISTKLNELRDCAVESTELIKTSDGKHYNKTNYIQIINQFKKEFKKEYSIIQTSMSKANIKKKKH